MGKFPEPRARFYSAEIALALEHIHKLDIVYRCAFAGLFACLPVLCVWMVTTTRSWWIGGLVVLFFLGGGGVLGV
jgi:hypothetical protein